MRPASGDPEPRTPGFPCVQWVCIPERPGRYEAQWQQAQQLLAARRRIRDFHNQDLQTLNDIAYIKTHMEEFVNPFIAQLNQLENQISQDLNTISTAASNAEQPSPRP